jgi:hypothetical protein
MTDRFSPPEELAPVMFPADLRREFGIITARGLRADQPFEFRARPGHAFELRGQAAPWSSPYGHSGYCSFVAIRFRPYQDPLTLAVRTADDPARIPDNLRTQIRHALWITGFRPHWRQVSQRDRHPWSLELPDDQPGAVQLAAATAENRARRTRRTHYTYPGGGLIICTTTPPSAELCYSVTPRCEWSAHDGERTTPLSQAPMAASYQPAPPAAAAVLAARDRAAAGSLQVAGQARRSEPGGLTVTARLSRGRR